MHRIWAAYGLDNFCPVFSFCCCFLVFGLDRRFCCFCHCIIELELNYVNQVINTLLDFFMNSYFFRIGLNFFNSSLSGVFFLFLVLI